MWKFCTYQLLEVFFVCLFFCLKSGMKKCTTMHNFLVLSTHNQADCTFFCNSYNAAYKKRIQ